MGTVQIFLFGSLRAISEGPSACSPCGDSQTVEQLVERMGLPQESVQLIMVNHKAATRQERVKAGDRVALFPKEYAVFVDWKDFRT